VHFKIDEAACPHCGAPRRDGSAGARTAGAVLMGLAIAACPGDDGASSSSSITAEPDYGVPATDSAETGGGDASATGGQSSTSAGTTASTSAGTTMQQTTDAGEAEYGVPDTGWGDSTTGESGSETGGTTAATEGTTTIEPDYGVPESG
jgi:hypothetical protein